VSNSQHVPERFQAAVDRLDGSAKLLREMAAITSEDIPEVMEACEASIHAGECEQAASHLHKLKGMLSTFESEGVTLEIQELVDLARKDRTEELQRGFQRNRDDIDELIEQVAHLARELE